MASHKLVPYWFRLRETYQTDDDDYFDLGNLTQERDIFNHDSIVDELDDFFDQYSGNIDEDTDRKRTFEVDEFDSDDEVVEGEIKLGTFGIEADVWDRQNDRRISNHRQAHHSEEVPFYFFFYKPDNVERRGVLVLEQFRNRGVKGELYSRLDEFFAEYDNDSFDRDLVFELNPVYTQDAEERVLHADDYKKLKFEGEQELTPVDEHADNEGATDLERKTVNRTYEMRPTSDDWTPDFVLSFLPNQNWKYGEVRENEFDDVKVTIEEDGSQMTFSLWDANIRMRRELDPSSLTLDGGHPTATSLSPKAREVANYVLPPEADEIEEQTLL